MSTVYRAWGRSGSAGSRRPGLHRAADDGARGAAGAERVSLTTLLLGLDAIPARRPVAAHVIALTDDPNVSAAGLAGVLGADAPLTARLMRLANSAYYGLSGRVRTVPFAVTAVGFSTVRSLAVVAAAGLDDVETLPPGFWQRSTATAVTAGELARRFGLPSPDTFCLGLLALVGQALLNQHDPEYAGLLAAASGRAALLQAEQARYGMGHTQVSSAALAAWSFPVEMPQVLRAVDDAAAGPAAPAAVCVRLALEIGERLTNPEHEATPLERLSRGRIDDEDIAPLLPRLAQAAADLEEAVTA
ncbi:HDOD domain-containing protein [Motilibacter aurantiacus]|uniref:HDOD domain-containing protein n=1 Tax=Motilibacter aurantiacus TaxID=2714955 RepID=UPI00140A71DB|nr:HDOD domain-containing protein [Motilibacter aurantiacus]NHC46133.1 HDOD domain-containing protein [Motilibacter aurantiacus]